MLAAFTAFWHRHEKINHCKQLHIADRLGIWHRPVRFADQRLHISSVVPVPNIVTQRLSTPLYGVIAIDLSTSRVEDQWCLPGASLQLAMRAAPLHCHEAGEHVAGS